MKSNVSRILFSIVLAFALWWYVISVVSPGFTDTVYNIPVILDGENVLNEKGFMVTGMSANKVSMKISGNRTNVVKINAENTTVRVDVSKINEVGTQIPMSFTPGFARDFNSAGINVELSQPSVIYLNVSKFLSKEVPVEVRWIGSAGDGFITDRENRTLDHSAVTISGPEEVVASIQKATVDVDLTGRTESISENFTYTLCDEEDTPVDADLVTTDVEAIRLEVKIQAVKEINLTYNLVDGGGAKASDVTVTLNRTTLRVAGSESALESLGDTFTVGTIHLAEVAHSGTVSLPIILPAGVRNLTGESEVTAEIEIHGLSTKELTLTNIRAINAPAGMAADIITKSMVVTVRGNASDIARVIAQSVRVVVDLTDAQVGTDTYKPSFEFVEGFESLGVLNCESVSVGVREH